jgi:hypothetical protein
MLVIFVEESGQFCQIFRAPLPTPVRHTDALSDIGRVMLPFISSVPVAQLSGQRPPDENGALQFLLRELLRFVLQTTCSRFSFADALACLAHAHRHGAAAGAALPPHREQDEREEKRPHDDERQKEPQEDQSQDLARNRPSEVVGSKAVLRGCSQCFHSVWPELRNGASDTHRKTRNHSLP